MYIYIYTYLHISSMFHQEGGDGQVASVDGQQESGPTPFLHTYHRSMH
jgi:hypothetical protein